MPKNLLQHRDILRALVKVIPERLPQCMRPNRALNANYSRSLIDDLPGHHPADRLVALA